MNPSSHRLLQRLALSAGGGVNRSLFSLTRNASLFLHHHQNSISIGPQSNATQLRNSHNYCPVFSLKQRHIFGDHCSSQIGTSTQYQQQRQLANTTSGTFAPSKYASSSRRAPSLANHQAAGTTNVYDLSLSEQLPSLPVPGLDDTLERLKETIWPMAMNSAEFAATLELIEQLAQSAGPKLDLLLRAKAGQLKNWLTHDWWVQEAYLKSRSPLVINSNPSMFYPQFPYEIDNQRLLVSTIAQLISGIIDFKLALKSGYNPEATSVNDEFRLDTGICYSQYRNIFSTIRVPGDQMDSLKFNENVDEDSPMTIVLSLRGQFYEISFAPDTIGQEETRVDTLVSLLNKLFDQQSDQQTELGAGLLTTIARDQWARTRPLLDADALESIERAQFVVCLDTIVSQQPQSQVTNQQQQRSCSEKFCQQLVSSPVGSPQHLEALSRQILHGDSFNVSNRWFDKSLQLIIVSDEQCQRFLGAGINYEHCTAEATVVTKLIEYSYDRALANHNRQSSNPLASTRVSNDSSLRLLNMFDEVHRDHINDTLKQAERDFVARVDQFDLAYFNHKSYGSNAIKSFGFSPDSWFQVALQLAHFQLHKRLGPCYETASTRRFAFGRTETIRSLTKDVAAFCQEPSYNSLQQAIKSHKSYAIAANNGSAIDRVLMGYRLVFNELRAGSWKWGVPLLDGKPITGLDSDKTKTTAESSSEQKLEDLFTEQELETLGAFFNNELIERSRKFALSTSQVTSVHPDICMSFGPLVTDGYGCCYNITGQQIVAAITANSENLSFSCEVGKLAEGLHDSLHQMRSIVDEERQNQRKI